MMVLSYIFVGFLGLILGSFVNVVIYRGPALWGLVGEDRNVRGTLLGPRSRCPACGSVIPVSDLIPIGSFLALGGKCRCCKAPIPARYPLVEALGLAAALISVSLFGFNWQAALAGLFFLSLIALAGIDAETGYLPEAITLPLIGLGLLANLFDLYTDKLWAFIGAAAGYAAFFLIAALYRRLRGRDGLGLGDAALFAAFGAWGGWPILAPTALLGALIALFSLWLCSVRTGTRIDAAKPVPFGPALCTGGAIAFAASQWGIPIFG